MPLKKRRKKLSQSENSPRQNHLTAQKVRNLKAIRDAPKKLRHFIQHGFVERSGRISADVEETNGDCPLCRKEGHFYIEIKTSNWKCHSCGKGGGYQKFLQAVYEEALQDGEEIDKLAKNRGLEKETLFYHGVRYNTFTEEYLYPVWNASGDGRLIDIRHCVLGGPMHATSGANVGLAGWEELNKSSIVWIFEGEWDALAFWEASHTKLSYDEIILVCPGAGVFKREWARLFDDKKVFVAFDNDKSGKDGSKRIYSLIKNITRELLFIKWDTNENKGFDVRDFYLREGQSTYQKLVKKLVKYEDYAPEDLVTIKNTIESKEDESIPDGEGVSPEDVYNTYQKWLYLDGDTILLDVVFGTVLANRREGEPLWLLLVAPPGGSKTAPIMSLEDAPRIVCKSSLKAKSLVSGQINSSGVDPSLIPKLNGRVLAVKDLTMLLSMPQQFRDEIFGILRDAFDGKVEVDFGNGKICRYESKFGFIAGVTPAIEHFFEGESSLGPRFLIYRTPIPNDLKGRRPYIQKARENEGKEKEMSRELRACAKLALSKRFPDNVIIGKEYDNRLIDISQWISVMRGVVNRDRWTKDVTHLPYSELATRLVKQLSKLLIGICQFRGVISPGEREFESIKRIAYGSVPSGLLRTIQAFYYLDPKDGSTGLTSRDIATRVGLSAFPTVERFLENLRMLGAIKSVDRSVNIKMTTHYELNDEFAEITASSGIFNL